MRKNILITGKPRSGKSTLLEHAVERIEPKVGILVKELRENGERIAFEMVTHQNNRAIFCDTRVETPHKIGRYFFNLPNLEAMLPSVSHFEHNDFLYLDEIGQMQLLSAKFKDLTLKFLDSSNTCLATISYIYEDDFTRMVKERKDVILVEITEENREEKATFVTQLIGKIEKAKKYSSEPDRFTKKETIIELRSEHGTRTLSLNEGSWTCDCDFYKKYQICSHKIATEEISS